MSPDELHAELGKGPRRKVRELSRERVTGRKTEARKRQWRRNREILERGEAGRSSQSKKLKERNPVSRRNNQG